MKSLLNIGLILLIFVLGSGSLYSQLYADNSLQVNDYLHSDPLDLFSNDLNYTLRIGGMVPLKSGGPIKLAAELEFFQRSFSQTIDGIHFRYEFPGFSLNTILIYIPEEKFQLESGLRFAAYNTLFYREGRRHDLGEGFRGWDIGLTLGFSYYIKKFLALGLRGNYWLVPMLKFREIGNFGELSSKQNDINLISGQLFLRLSILNGP